MLNKTEVLALRGRAQAGLRETLDFFADHAMDPEGGFYGKVDRDLRPVKEAERSLVFNARMLWTYAAAYRLLREERYLAVAMHALDYIERCFLDGDYGGGYWSLRPDGSPADERKYVYGQSFLIYGGAELFRACGQARGLRLAKAVYALLEEKKSAFDPRVFFPPIMDTVLTGNVPDDDVALLMSRVEAGVKEAVGSLIVNFGSYGKAPLVEQKSLEDMIAFYKK